MTVSCCGWTLTFTRTKHRRVQDVMDAIALAQSTHVKMVAVERTLTPAECHAIQEAYTRAYTGAYGPLQ